MELYYSPLFPVGEGNFGNLLVGSGTGYIGSQHSRSGNSLALILVGQLTKNKIIKSGNSTRWCLDIFVMFISFYFSLLTHLHYRNDVFLFLPFRAELFRMWSHYHLRGRTKLHNRLGFFNCGTVTGTQVILSELDNSNLLDDPPVATAALVYKMVEHS